MHDLDIHSTGTVCAGPQGGDRWRGQLLSSQAQMHCGSHQAAHLCGQPPQWQQLEAPGGALEAPCMQLAGSRARGCERVFEKRCLGDVV